MLRAQQRILARAPTQKEAAEPMQTMSSLPAIRDVHCGYSCDTGLVE